VTTIRQETRADVPAVRGLVATAFGDENVARLVDLIRQSPYFLPELSLVAEADGKVVGHVLFSRAPLRRNDGDGEVELDAEILLLSPLAVHPDFQGRGIGGALVRRGLDMANDRGEPMVILEGSPKLYGRFGFERAADHGIERPSDRIPDAAFQVRLLDAYEETLTGRVEYPSAFWETGSVGP
jgi:putative acetyltransferase